MQIAVDQAQFAQRWVEDPGWRCCAGFITVPNIALSFLEFLKIAPAGYSVMSHLTQRSVECHDLWLWFRRNTSVSSWWRQGT